MRRLMIGAALGGVLMIGCGGGDGESTDTSSATGSEVDDRVAFHDEVDGVRAEVADCFVVDLEGTSHFQATIEVRNRSDVARVVTVSLVGTDGAESDSPAVEVPAGGVDAWPITVEEQTDLPIGDVECSAHVTGLAVRTEPAGG
jgi:hypothetical protein